MNKVVFINLILLHEIIEKNSWYKTIIFVKLRQMQT